MEQADSLRRCAQQVAGCSDQEWRALAGGDAPGMDKVQRLASAHACASAQEAALAAELQQQTQEYVQEGNGVSTWHPCAAGACMAEQAAWLCVLLVKLGPWSNVPLAPCHAAARIREVLDVCGIHSDSMSARGRLAVALAAKVGCPQRACTAQAPLHAAAHGRSRLLPPPDGTTQVASALGCSEATPCHVLAAWASLLLRESEAAALRVGSGHAAHLWALAHSRMRLHVGAHRCTGEALMRCQATLLTASRAVCNAAAGQAAASQGGPGAGCGSGGCTGGGAGRRRR